MRGLSRWTGSIAGQQRAGQVARRQLGTCPSGTYKQSGNICNDCQVGLFQNENNHNLNVCKTCAVVSRRVRQMKSSILHERTRRERVTGKVHG